MLDNRLAKFDNENEIKANAGTKGAAFHIALICLLKNLNNKETQSFARASAKVFVKLKEYEMIRVEKFDEKLFVETALNLFNFLASECISNEVKRENLFILREDFRGESKWKDSKKFGKRR